MLVRRAGERRHHAEELVAACRVNRPEETWRRSRRRWSRPSTRPTARSGARPRSSTRPEGRLAAARRRRRHGTSVRGGRRPPLARSWLTPRRKRRRRDLRRPPRVADGDPGRDLRLRRRAHDTADRLVHGVPRPDRDHRRVARQRDAARSTSATAPPSPVRAREGADDRGRVPDEPWPELAVELGHEPEMHGFKEVYFEALEPNQPMIEAMRAAKERAGNRMALLTNNVREWEPSGARCCRSTRSSSWSSTPRSSACVSPSPRSTGSRSSAFARPSSATSSEMPVRRRRRGQLRRRPRARHQRRALPRQRPGDPRTARGAGLTARTRRGRPTSNPAVGPHPEAAEPPVLGW